MGHSRLRLRPLGGRPHLDLVLLAGYHGRESQEALQGGVSRHVQRHGGGLQLLPESPRLPGHAHRCRTLQRQDGGDLWVHLDRGQGHLLYWLLQWNTKEQNSWIIHGTGPGRGSSADDDLPASWSARQVVGHTTGFLTLSNIITPYVPQYHIP